MKNCPRCGGQLIIEGDWLVCLQCGAERERVIEAKAEDERKCANDKRGIRYPEAVKRAAALDVFLWADREEVCRRVGCEINTLKKWEKDYSAGEEVKVMVKKRRTRLFRYPEDVKRQAVAALEGGEHWKDIIKRVGCSHPGLLNWVEKYGSTKPPEPTTQSRPWGPSGDDLETLPGSPHGRALEGMLVEEPPGQPSPPRHPNGTLDYTEEERLAILDNCRRRGVKVVAKETGVNRSTLARWARCLRKTGFTLAIDNPQVSTYTDHISALRELQSKITAEWYDLDRQREAVNTSLNILIEQKKAEVVK